MFLKEFSYARQGNYLIKNTVKTEILWNIIAFYNDYFYFNIFNNVIYYSSLQWHMILQKSF